MRKILRALPLITLLVLLSAVVTSTHAQQSRQVFAFYFPWWTGGSWGDERLIDRPLEQYEGRDTNAQARHIAQAQGAGIDAFIVAWYGTKDGNLTHEVFNQMLDGAGNAGFKIGAALDLHEDYYNSSIEEVIGNLQHLVHDRVHHGAYVRWNGKPVIYFWNQGRYSLADWQNIRAQVDPDRTTIWVMEGTGTSYLRVFDSLYLFNVAWSGNPASTARQWKNAAAAGGSGFYSPTVLPGWDESALAAGRPNPTAVKPRNDGQFLTNSWNGAVASGADTILVVSWNEYFENSHIEPSQVYGTQALDTLRTLIGAWKQPAAPADPASANNAPQGLTFTAGQALRFRSGPVEGGNVIGQVPAGAVLTIVGRSADGNWVQLDNNGVIGWAAGWLGTVNGGNLNDAPVAE